MISCDWLHASNSCAQKHPVSRHTGVHNNKLKYKIHTPNIIVLVAWHIIHLHLQMVPVKSILFTNIMYTLIARCIMASAGVCWPPTPYRIWARFKTNVADLGRKQSRKSQFIRIQYHLQRHTYSKKFVLHSPFRVPFALNARHLTVYCIYYYNAVREKIVCALIICLPYMQQHNIANWAVLF